MLTLAYIKLCSGSASITFQLTVIYIGSHFVLVFIVPCPFKSLVVILCGPLHICYRVIIKSGGKFGVVFIIVFVVGLDAGVLSLRIPYHCKIFIYLFTFLLFYS